MTGLQLLPVDTWFFRDGTPFTMGDAPQEGVGSLFPPHPPTVVGAIRAALARSNGWDGRSPWLSAICDVLGDGPENLGRVSVDGPFLLRGEEPLYRMPRHVVGSTDDGRWKPSELLRPGDEAICDLGRVRLPEPVGGTKASIETGDRHWLTRRGMNAVLNGCPPGCADIVCSEELWSAEPRIGLERDRGTRTAEEGKLYSTRHVRLAQRVALGMRVLGIPEGWHFPFGEMVPMGGESRLADCREWKADVSLDSLGAGAREAGRLAVVALSPVDLTAAEYLGREPLALAGGVRVVSACLDRPQRIGGWDSQARTPLPMRSVLTPGSVLFCEVADPRAFEGSVVGAEGLVRIGRRRDWGFGLAALGRWPGDGPRFA